MSKELDFITAMNIIERVENSDFKGDYAFLKFVLGKETFKTMATMGYIHGAYREKEDGEIVDTYSVTKSYDDWNKHLKPRRFMTRLKTIFRV